jgi:hypothetical protein
MRQVCRWQSRAARMADAPMKGSVAAVTAMLSSIALLDEGSVLLLHGGCLSSCCAAAQIGVHACVQGIDTHQMLNLKLPLDAVSSARLACICFLLLQMRHMCGNVRTWKMRDARTRQLGSAFG